MVVNRIRKELAEKFAETDRIVNDPKKKEKALENAKNYLHLWGDRARVSQNIGGPFANGKDVIETPSNKRVQQIMEEVKAELQRALSSGSVLKSKSEPRKE